MSQVINNNEVIKSQISAVVVKKGALQDSSEKTQLKSDCSNLGVCHVDLDTLEDWKETVHNFSNVCSLQNVLCGITRELTLQKFCKTLVEFLLSLKILVEPILSLSGNRGSTSFLYLR